MTRSKAASQWQEFVHKAKVVDGLTPDGMLKALGLAAGPLLDLVAERDPDWAARPVFGRAPPGPAAQDVFQRLAEHGLGTYGPAHGHAGAAGLYNEARSRAALCAASAAEYALRAAEFARGAALADGLVFQSPRVDAFFRDFGYVQDELGKALEAVGVACPQERVLATYLDARASVLRARKAAR